MNNRCQSCGYIIGQHMYNFITARKEILKDTKMKEEDKYIAIKELIDSYKLPRYCCRAQLLSWKDIVNDI